MTNAQIEGVPVGMRLVRIGYPIPNELYIDSFGGVYRWQPNDPQTREVKPIVAFDNVYNQALEDVPVPEGYERDGETVEEWFRPVRCGDKYMPSYGTVVYEMDSYGCTGDPRRIILRKIAPKTKRVLIGEWEIKDQGSPDRSDAWSCSQFKVDSLFREDSSAIGGAPGNFRIEERPV